MITGTGYEPRHESKGEVDQTVSSHSEVRKGYSEQADVTHKHNKGDSMGRTDFDVVVENQPVRAGGKMVGAVYVDAPKQISGSRLMVKLTGTEKATVRFDEGDWSSSKWVDKNLKPILRGVQSAVECLQRDNNSHNKYNYKRTKDAYIHVLSVEVPVGTESMISSKKIEPGKYKMPFEIDLPPPIPACLNLQVEDGSCEINYQIEAHLEGSGWFKDFKAFRMVSVQAKPAEEVTTVVPFEAPPESMPIRMVKCIMGQMTYACQLDNTILVTGKSAQVSIACRNDSTLGISSVDAQIVQITNWEAGNRDSEHEKIILSQSIPQWADLEPLSKEEQQIHQQAESAERQQLYNALKTGAHKIHINVPLSAVPSYQGQLISIQHVVRVKFVSQYYIDFVAPCPTIDIPCQLLAADKHMTPPPFELPLWANDVANFVVATAVSVQTQNIQFHGIVCEDEDTLNAPVPKVVGMPSMALLIDAMKRTSNDLGLVNQNLETPFGSPRSLL